MGERPIASALIGAGAVVAAALIGLAATSMGRDASPATAPTQSASPSATPESTPPSPDTPAPTDAASRLLSYLPEAVSNCNPTDVPPGVLARFKCAAEPKQGQVYADVYFALYDNAAASRTAFQRVVPADVPVSIRVCPDGPDQSDYTIPDVGKAGQLACYVDGTYNAPRIIWTRDEPSILAEAVGPAGVPLKRLWKVWLRLPIDGK